MTAPAHIYEIFIRATQDEVWNALIDPEYTRQYFHGTHFESTFEPGSGYRNILGNGTDAVDGVIDVFEPPHRLVMTWHVLYDTDMADEPPGRVEWRLAPAIEDGSITRVTLRHGGLASSPLTWAHVRIGWVEIIDGLKTLLETGEPLAGVDIGNGGADDKADERSDGTGEWHRLQAIAANNATWDILGDPNSLADGRDQLLNGDQLLNAAHAAAYHWAQAADGVPANNARASWLLSRCHVVLGHGDLALHHAERSADVVSDAGLDGFDLAYAHEARARALACLGRRSEAETERNLASAVEITDPEDRRIFVGDLEADPWFVLEDAAPAST